MATTPASSFPELIAKYVAAGVPRARDARTPGQLLDLVVRQRIFERPRLDYSTAMREVLAADPVLKKAYAES